MDDVAGLARVVLAGVFITAAWAKLSARDAFRTSVRGLGVPAAITPMVAATVPFVELAIAASLIISATARGGALAALALLAIFSLGIGLNLARGNRPECNCFGQVQAAPISAASLVRNGLFAAVAAFIAVVGSGRFVGAWVENGTPLQAVAFAGVIAVFVLGAFMLQLTAQQGRLLARIDELENNGVADVHNHEHDQVAPTAGLPVGSPAPAFSLASLAGGGATLASLMQRGTPVMLVFVSSNCVACHDLLPDVARWQRDYASHLTLAVIGSGDAAANRERFAAEGLDYALLDGDGSVGRAYQYFATPCAVMIEDGTIATPMYTGPDDVRSLVNYAVSL